MVAYSAAKAAVLNLRNFLRVNGRRKGVRVNTITPGFFPAEQNRKLLFNDDGSPTARAASHLGAHADGRFGESRGIDRRGSFPGQSDKASSFVTGTDIRVDGGFLSQTI